MQDKQLLTLIALGAVLLVPTSTLAQKLMKPAAQQSCRTTQRTPAPAPPQSEGLLALKVAYDSLKTELRQLATDAGIKDTGHVAFGMDGSTPAIEFIDLKVSAATRDQMRARIVAHLERFPNGNHVTMNGWSPADSLPDQIESCQPAVRNEQEITRSMQRAIQSFNSPTAPGPRATRLQVFVMPNGRVLVAKVVQSSGDAEYDRAALRIAKQMEFFLALVNGQPTSMSITIPILFPGR